jgi:hypothetical protein
MTLSCLNSRSCLGPLTRHVPPLEKEKTCKSFEPMFVSVFSRSKRAFYVLKSKQTDVSQDSSKHTLRTRLDRF